MKFGPIGPTSPRRHWSSLDIDFARAISAENRHFLSEYRAYRTLWKETAPRCGDVSAVAELRAAISQPHINWPSIMAIIIGKIGSLRAQALFCKTRRARWPPFRHYLRLSARIYYLYFPRRGHQCLAGTGPRVEATATSLVSVL